MKNNNSLNVYMNYWHVTFWPHVNVKERRETGIVFQPPIKTSNLYFEAYSVCDNLDLIGLWMNAAEKASEVHAKYLTIKRLVSIWKGSLADSPVRGRRRRSPTCLPWTRTPVGRTPKEERPSLQTLSNSELLIWGNKHFTLPI